jgi:hypothetical protein
MQASFLPDIRLAFILLWMTMAAHPILIEQSGQRIMQVNANSLVKRGWALKIEAEAATMQFVKKHTEIPVPSIRRVWRDQQGLYAFLEMDRMPGKGLDKAWPEMSPGARATTITQLKNHWSALRALRQPDPGWIGSWNRGGLFDDRLGQKTDPTGPWNSEQDFNNYLVRNVVRDAPTRAERFIKSMRAYRHKVVFTHGDMAGDHILVEPVTGAITGILDWEMAGWLPEYWEYLKARSGWRYEDWWVSLLKGVLTSYDDERTLDFDLECY